MTKKRTLGISCFLLLMAFLLVPLTESFAVEPAPTFKYLMHEPVTMLDWGMYKLALYLNQELRDRYLNKVSKFAPRITVHYNADSDKIQISASMLYTKFHTKDEARTYCEGIIKYVRGLLVFKQGKAKSRVSPVVPSTTLGSYFGSHGQHHKNKPENMEGELSKSTELIAVVMDKFDQPVICKAPLLGSEIMFLYGPYEQDSQTTMKEDPSEQEKIE